MIQYNKVRGILRARNGSQFPKYIRKAEDGTKAPAISEAATSNMSKFGKIADVARGFIGALPKSETTARINQGYDAIANAAMMFTPVGTIIGGAMKVGGLVGDALNAAGIGTDQMTVADLILDSNFMKLSPISLANSALAKKTRSFAKDTEVEETVGSSYGGSMNEINKAVSKAGKKYGFFSSKARRKANSQIAEAERKQNIMSDITDETQIRNAMANNLTQLQSLNYQYNLSGGPDYLYMRAAKLGAKIDLVKSRKFKQVVNVETKQVEEFKDGGTINPQVEVFLNLDWEPVIEEFKEGGKTKDILETPEIEETTQKNLIPEGALHKNKHHIEHTDGLTLKGIPVVDNEGNQQAEIEHSEIIFTLEVTKKLEELYKEGTDEAAIEAGKLLVKEILFNTDDRTSLIDKILI